MPKIGLEVSKPFGYSPATKDEWVSHSNHTFAVNPEGDNLFLYCETGSGEPHFIFGFSFFGTWSEPGLAEYDVNQSALPDSLLGMGSIAVSGSKHWKYVTKGINEPEALRADFSNVSSWQGSDVAFNVDLKNAGSSASVLALTTMWALLCLVMLGKF